MAMLPVTVHIPVAGSYSSAVAVAKALKTPPPATSTSPFASNVAVWCTRAVAMLPVAVHILVVGSYCSAVAVMKEALLTPPPATSTSPFGNNVAV